MTFQQYTFLDVIPVPRKTEIIFHVKLIVLIILSTNSDSTVAAIILGKLCKYTIRMIFHANFFIVVFDHITDDLFSSLLLVICEKPTVFK